MLINLLFCCAINGMMPAAPWGRFTGWIEEQPTTVLLLATRVPIIEPIAIGELWDRTASGRLPDEEIVPLAVRALEMQRDSQRKFDRRWGDMIEELEHDHKLPSRLWEQYVQQVVAQTVELRVPPRAVAGEKVEIELHRKMMLRTGLAIHLAAYGAYSLWLDDRNITSIARHESDTDSRVYIAMEAVQLPSAPGQWIIPAGDDRIGELAEGKHHIRLKLSLAVEDCQDAHRRVPVEFSLDGDMVLVGASK